MITGSRTKRTPQQTLASRARIAELHLKGLSLKNIAEELRRTGGPAMSIATIHRDIKQIEQAWRHEQVDSLALKKARQLAKLDALQSEAWQAFEQSKKPRHSRTTTAVPHDAATVLKQSKTTVQECCGDPRLLQVIFSCIQEQNELLGLYHLDDNATSLDLVARSGIDPYHAYAVLEEEWKIKHQRSAGPGG